MRRALFFVGTIAIGGALAAFAGCSSFDSAAPPEEAGLDAPIDQAIDQAVVPEEAAADAAPSFCQTIDASFCDDFESATALDASYMLYEMEGTLYYLDGGAPLSPLHCVHSATISEETPDGGPEPSPQAALVVKQFAVFPDSTLSIDADLRITAAAPPGSNTLEYALSFSGPDPIDRAVYFNVAPGGVVLVADPGNVDGGTPVVTALPTSLITLGTWFHVRVEVHRDPFNFVTMAVNGQNVATMNTNVLDDATPITMAAGVAGYRGPQANAIDVDNLVFDSY